MKKSLIIMVALVALVANSALAGDVTIYGRAHFSLESLSDGENSGMFLSNNSSRIGFKGATELDYDLSAFWQVETKLEMMDGKGNVWASRNTFAGIKGNFGKALFGYHDTPFKTVGRKFDYFGDTLGDARNITNVAGTDLDSRFNNVIMYTTPDFEGFTACLAYELADKEEITEDDTYADMSFNAFYKAEKFIVAAAMQMRPDGQFGDPEDNETQTAMRFAGKYLAEKFSVAGLFQMVSNAEGDEDVSTTVMGFGAGYDVNENVTLKGQYYMVTASVEGLDEDPTGNQITLGADYKLAKSTKVYALFTMLSDEDSVGLEIGGGGHGESTGCFEDSASGFGIGMIHNF